MDGMKKLLISSSMAYVQVKEAIFAWAVASYCAPQRTTLHSYAKELIDTAKDNILWFKDHCLLDDFPYRWEVIENSFNDMH